jgi:hypothetical protein
MRLPETASARSSSVVPHVATAGSTSPGVAAHGGLEPPGSLPSAPAGHATPKRSGALRSRPRASAHAVASAGVRATRWAKVCTRGRGRSPLGSGASGPKSRSWLAPSVRKPKPR